MALNALRFPRRASKTRPDLRGQASALLTRLWSHSIWLVFFACSLLFLLHVVWYGSKLPSEDDFRLVPVVTGAQALSFEWLWEPFFQHRMPLPKLLLVALTAPTQSFLPSKYLNFLLLAGGAALVLRTLVQSPRPANLAFAAVPMAFLSVSQIEVIETGIALNLVLASMLMVAVLVLVARERRPDSPRSLWLLAAALVAIPLCGMVGVVFVPAMAVWMAVLAITERSRRKARFLWCSLAAMALLGTAYFHNLELPAQHTEALGGKLVRLANQAARLFSLSAGWTSPETWRSSAILMAIPTVIALGLCVKVFVTNPEERIRASGMLAWFAGWAVLIAGIAWGRSGNGDMFLSRYVTLLMPVNAWIVLVSVRYGGRWKYVLPIYLLGVQLYCYPGGQAIARHNGTHHQWTMRRLEHDVKAGVPVSLLGEQYSDELLFGEREHFEQHLCELCDARWRPFTSLRESAFVEIEVPLTEPMVLPTRMEVAAVRLTYRTLHEGSDATLVMDVEGPPPREAKLKGQLGEHSVLVYLKRPLETISWHHTGEASTFRFERMTILRLIR